MSITGNEMWEIIFLKCNVCISRHTPVWLRTDWNIFCAQTTSWTTAELSNLCLPCHVTLTKASCVYPVKVKSNVLGWTEINILSSQYFIFRCIFTVVCFRKRRFWWERPGESHSICRVISASWLVFQMTHVTGYGPIRKLIDLMLWFIFPLKVALCWPFQFWLSWLHGFRLC